MTRAADKVRCLYELRGPEVARQAEQEVQGLRLFAEHLLEVSPAGTAVAADLAHLTKFAQGDLVCTVDEVLAIEQEARIHLAWRLSSVAVPVSPQDDAVLGRVDPYLDEVTVVLAAVLGRCCVYLQRPVPDSWVAALLGLDRDTISVYLWSPKAPKGAEPTAREKWRLDRHRPAGERPRAHGRSRRELLGVTWESARRVLEARGLLGAAPDLAQEAQSA